MKMKTVEISVGAFMVAGIAALLMLALQVSGMGNFFHKESGYTVTAAFSNIGGLKVRAKVSVAGVVVGRVVGVLLNPTSFDAEVVMIIDPKRLGGKLPADTRASIMTAGLLGDNYIALAPGFSEKEFLSEGSQIPVDNTDSAVVLEQLISKFVANQVSPGAGSSNGSSAGSSTDSSADSSTKDAKDPIDATDVTNAMDPNAINTTKEQKL